MISICNSNLGYKSVFVYVTWDINGSSTLYGILYAIFENMMYKNYWWFLICGSFRSVKSLQSEISKCLKLFSSNLLNVIYFDLQTLKALFYFCSREHFHCLDCNSRVFVKKEEMIRHFKWHKKRDESLQHGFMRYSPSDDCSDRFQNCSHNRKQTHYHCIQVSHLVWTACYCWKVLMMMLISHQYLVVRALSCCTFRNL